MATERIKSEITGTVWKILMAEGDAIDVAAEIMILESMKMEIPVESTVSGRIQTILVAPGDAVDEDQDLAIIELD